MEYIHWHNWIVILVGALTAALPYFVTYTAPEGVSVDLLVTAFVLSGGLVAVLGAIGAFTDFIWQDWVTGLLGVWLVAMPSTIGFSSVASLMYGSVGAGLLLIVLAGLALRAISEGSQG